MTDMIEISEDELQDFAPLLGEDMAEDLRRIYFKGIGAVDEKGSPLGALVYELLHSDSEEDTAARICMLKADDGEVSDSMEDFYRQNSVPENEIVETTYELENEPAAKALEDKGFSLEKKENDVLTITLGEIAATELGKGYKLPEYVGNIEELSIMQFRNAVKQILFKGHPGSEEDLPFLPKSWFDNKVSACITSGEKNPGLFLIRRTPSGVLIPVLFFAYGPESKKHLLIMIHYAAQQALRLYPPETPVRISRKNPSTRTLMDKLLPDWPVADIFYGTRKEQ